MPVSNKLITLAALAIVVGLSAEAWTRISVDRDLRESAAALTARANSSDAAATLAGVKAEQALARANEAVAQAERAAALAAEAKDTADRTAASIALALPETPPGAAQPGAPVHTSAEQGRGLALLICSACHVVSPDQQLAPTLRPPAPDFHALVNRPATDAQSLGGFLRAPHGKMPDAMLANYQINALVAYLMSLKDQR